MTTLLPLLKMSSALPSLRRLSLMLLAGAALLMAACATHPTQAPREPFLGQAGKDAVWIRTPEYVVQRMLQLAQLRPGERLVDLGAGDGQIVIAGARDFGATGVGIEYDPALVTLGQQKARDAGVGDRVRMVQGDIFKTDYSDADVVSIYLWPHLNLRLRHQLMALEPGTRIVTYQFHMGDWPADEISSIQTREAFLWVVPANMGGNWLLSFPHGNQDLTVSMTLSQTFQHFGGTVALPPGFNTTLRDATLLGRSVSFSFTDADGHRRHFSGEVDGDRLRGTVTGPRGPAAFEAERIGTAPAIRGSEPVPQDVIDRSRVDF